MVNTFQLFGKKPVPLGVVGTYFQRVDDDINDTYKIMVLCRWNYAGYGLKNLSSELNETVTLRIFVVR